MDKAFRSSPGTGRAVPRTDRGRCNFLNRLNYILKRILQMIPVLFVVTILVFSIIRFIPGEPARLILGENATE